MGRLKNILSDRRLLEHYALRFDILYFLGYDVDEELSEHSTVSRTHQLYPAAVFEHLFDHIFRQCVACGLVSGERQALDSAPTLANTSLNRMCEKQPLNPGIGLGSRAGRFLSTRAASPGVFVRCRTVDEPLRRQITS